MLRISFLFSTCILLASCSNSKSKAPESPSKKIDNVINENTTPDEEDKAEIIIYTGEAVIDGPEEYLWIFTPGTLDNKEEEFTPCDELHIIPHYEANDGKFDGMIGVYANDFKLTDPFNTHSGFVKYYYDQAKSHLAADFEVVDGKPEGEAIIYDLDGNVYLKRTYEEGNWVTSQEAPACSDWKFDQATSEIQIKDLENGKAGDTIRLMPSVHKDEASFDKILDKTTYQRPLKINGNTFTGTLEAYYESSSFELPMRFTLQFKEGLLHGDIKIFNGLEMLELHEIFVDGELDSTIYVIDWSEMDGVAKPVIYLYPEDTTMVNVRLDFAGKLTTTYPHYNESWSVKACPDGTLFDDNGQEYYALYWEGDNASPFTLKEGNVVKGENTVQFLEHSLDLLGLSRKEANEFIMYWLPKMEKNAYNFIHFSTTEYEQMAKLNMTPKPETIIRVMMVFEPLEESINKPVQNLELLKQERTGFTVVEWGGKEVHHRMRYL